MGLGSSESEEEPRKWNQQSSITRSNGSNESRIHRGPPAHPPMTQRLSSILSAFECYGDENRNEPTKPSSEAATSVSTFPTSSHNHPGERSEPQASTSSRCDLRPGLSEDCVPGPPIRSNRLRSPLVTEPPCVYGLG